MGAAGSWGQVGEGARQLGGSKACAQTQRGRHRALPKALPSAAGPSMQGENPLPGSPCFCPGPRPAQPPPGVRTHRSPRLYWGSAACWRP